MVRVKYIAEGCLVECEMQEESKTCQHKIVRMEEPLQGTRYRYCEKCGLVAHEDGRFDYCCGFEYCKCMQ